MANGGKITAIIDLDASGVKKGSKEAREAVEQIDNSLKSMESGFKSVEKAGKLMTTAITLPIVGFGALSINTAKDFEYAMSEVQAISGATGDELKALEDQARELGRTTFYSASEASEGMKYYAMAQE